MKIEFQETSGWWLELNGREVREAVNQWLQRQGCTITNGKKEAVATVCVRGESEQNYALKKISMHVPVHDGSITFRGDVGPKETAA